MSRNTKHYNVAIVAFFMCIIPTQGDAQIMDYIEGKVSDYIQEKVEDYIDSQTDGMYYKAKSFLNNPIGTLWGSYVEESAINSVREKASGLANFDVSKSQLDILRNSYGIDPRMPTDKKTLLLPLQYGISESFTEAISPEGNRQLDKIGSGIIAQRTAAYKDSLIGKVKVLVIEAVLCQQTLDSVKTLMDNSTERILCKDLENYPQLITTMNRHPETVRVYVNSLSTDLRLQPAHLIYWGKLADAHRSKLPRKTKLPNPRYFKFVEKGNEVNIEFQGEQLGTYNPLSHIINCQSAELLNFMPMPDCTYNFGSTTFAIDRLGRLSYLSTPMNVKEQTVEKTSVKLKDLQNAIEADANSSLYMKVLKKMKVQPAMAFLLTPATQLDNATVKEKQKSFKKILKYAPESKAFFSFDRHKGQIEPKTIYIEQLDNAPINQRLEQGTEVKSQKKFLDNLKSFKSEHYVMDGTIDGKYPIVMNFICCNGNISGNYFYSKFGDQKRMTLKGSIDSSKSVSIKEYDENGVCQGEFQGDITSTSFFGHFVKDGKRMPFSVTQRLEK